MEDIYREQLMEHYKHPHNMGEINEPSKQVEKNNPYCGDLVSMQIKLKDGKIEDIKFKASACAVTVASSSLLTEEMKGKTIDEVKRFTKEKLLELLGVELTTSRTKCAVLPLEALQSMLEGFDDDLDEEPQKQPKAKKVEK
jgi:nitrogen fixation NifU-like protein